MNRKSAIRLSKPLLRRLYSTPPPSASSTPGAPPLLLKLRNDLKDAMRAKDTNRLSVLRSTLADVTNLSKTNTPIKTDIQLLALLRKRAVAAKQAADEFKQHQRQDLAEKEEAQERILEEYAGQVEVVDPEEVQTTVGVVMDELKANGEKLVVGMVIKRLFEEGGKLNGKPVDRGDVARIVTEALKTKG